MIIASGLRGKNTMHRWIGNGKGIAKMKKRESQFWQIRESYGEKRKLGKEICHEKKKKNYVPRMC